MIPEKTEIQEDSLDSVLVNIVLNRPGSHLAGRPCRYPMEDISAILH